MDDRGQGHTTLGDFFILEKWWVRWLLAMCAALAVWLVLSSWGLGGSWTPAIVGAVVTLAVGLYLDQKYGPADERLRMPTRYTGPSGPRYRCELCGQEFPNQAAGFAHADGDHIETTVAEARAAMKPIASEVGWERTD
jgi:hypothetical protein